MSPTHGVKSGYHGGRIDRETITRVARDRYWPVEEGPRFLTEDLCTCPRKQLVRSNTLYFSSCDLFLFFSFGLFRNEGDDNAFLALRPLFFLHQNLKNRFSIRLASKISSNDCVCVEMILLHRARSAVRQAAESSSWSVVMIRGNLR